MTFYWLPPFLAGIFDLFLALLVLQRAPRRTLNRVFMLFALSLTSWNFDIASLYFFTDYNLALQWSENFRYGMLFIPPTVFHLTLILTARKTLPNRLFLAAGYVIAFVLALGNSRGILVQRLEMFTWGFYPVGTPLYKFHTFSDLFYFAAVLYQLIRGFLDSESARQREQLRLTLLGFAVALPVGLTNLLPVYGVSFYPLGSFGNVVLCGVLTYAIVRHRFLDIELIVTKTVASACALILWLAPLWMLTAEVQHLIYGEADNRLLLFALVVFVLSGLVFPWLLRSSERVVRRLLWGQRYSAAQALSTFQETLVHAFDQKKILTDLREVLADALQTEFVAVHLFQPAMGAYVDAYGVSAPCAASDDLPSLLMGRTGPVVREEIILEEHDPDALRLAASLAARRGEVCAPLIAQERLLGFLLLGEKRSRDIFSTEDLQLLSTVATGVAVALENARLYEELRNSQIMLARTDRLAAVGTLAAGIAHEIRNPLVAVQTFVQLLPEQIDDLEFRTTFLELTNSELARVSTLINDLMTFARPSPAFLDEADLNELAAQVVRLLTGQAKKQDVTLTARLSPEDLRCVVDQGQIKQIFMNLLMNAMQATPAGGAVTISTSTMRETEGEGYCVIEVHDTGSGISPEQKEQIFDPFFTTKDSGVGLGLFITHQIIKEHGGFIDVESEVGQGTRFFIRLPMRRLFTQETPLPEATSNEGELTTAVAL
ncbi:MAG: ATP-binding protein [Candidatus Binatia bacterium]